MEQNTAGLEASTATKGLRYARHSPDQTLLYQLVERYYPELAELLAEQGRPLPRHIRKEFDEYLKCGRHNMATEVELVDIFKTQIVTPTCARLKLDKR